LKIVICGLSITSSWGNGHATTFRALARALHARGHEIVFFERDVEWYSSNRDLANPAFCRVELYDDWKKVLRPLRTELKNADVAMVGSYFPDGIQAIHEMLDSNARVKTFYDIDTPITVAKLQSGSETEYILRSQIPGLDVYFSFTGGPMLRQIEQDFGASRAVPLYCSFDPERYHRYPTAKRFACDLSYMGTYAPDRQPKLEELLSEPARRLKTCDFLVAGPQYPRTVHWPQNVRRIMHLNPRWHPHFYSSSRITLNVTRRDMVQAGYSPSVRLFEAAACGAPIASDNWPGLDTFFTPGKEILLPSRSDDMVRYLCDLSNEQLREIGQAAQARVLNEHTSEIRAKEFESAVERRSAQDEDANSSLSSSPVGAI
jgi:spore maturation protein CgeB